MVMKTYLNTTELASLAAKCERILDSGEVYAGAPSAALHLLQVAANGDARILGDCHARDVTEIVVRRRRRAWEQCAEAQCAEVEGDDTLLDLANEQIWSSPTVREAIGGVYSVFNQRFRSKTLTPAVIRFVSSRLQGPALEVLDANPTDLAFERAAL